MRQQPVPAYLESAVNLHLLSDTHCQADPTASLRVGKVLDDCNRMIGRQTIDAHLVMGDLANTPRLEDAAVWRGWRNRLAGNGHPRPVYACLGNHDVEGKGVAWTSTQAAAALQLPAPNYTVDLGPVKLIVLAPVDDGTAYRWRLTLGPTELAFLDAELGNTTKPCVVMFHAPLAETVGGPIGWHSGEPGIQAHPVAELEQILGAHVNAVAWLSGHTHAPIETPGALTVLDLGGHKLAAINVTGVWYTSPEVQAHDPLRGLLLSVLDEHTMEVRFRDHGAGVWTVPSGGENLGRKVVRLQL